MVLALFSPAFGLAEEASVGSVLVESIGFVQVDFDVDSDTDPDLARRIRPLFTLRGNNGWGAVFEFDLSKTESVNGENGNWLEKGYVFREVSDTTTIRFGRLFLGGQYNTPPPFLLKTVNYARAYPFNSFAYGLQVVRRMGRLQLIADVSGNSNSEFNGSGQFERVETSGQLKRTLSEDFSHAFGWQISEDFIRGSADVSWVVSPRWNIFGGVYYSDENEDRITGVVLIEFTPNFFLRPHIQVDYGPDGNVEETVGLGVYWNEEWRTLVDYEVESGRTFARLQYRWK